MVKRLLSWLPNKEASYALYLLTVSLTAACGLVVEIVAGRMLAPYIGMSTYTWTAIIAVVLAGFSLGHWVGGIMAMWPASKAERSLSLVLWLAGLSAAASLILVRVLSGPLLSFELSNVNSIVLLTSALFFLPSFFVGIPSPILTKLAIDSAPEQMGRRLGAMYAVGAFGSIIGTLAAGFIFISWLGTIGTIVTVATIYMVLGTVFFFRGPTRLKWRATWPLFIVGALLYGTFAVGERVLAFKSNCTTETQYYCVRIVDISAQAGSTAKLMVLDHLGHGMNVKQQPEQLLSPYVELQDALFRTHLKDTKKQFHAYFVGGGAYTLPRAWLTTFPESRITVAEIDPVVTKFARSEMWLEPTNRLTVVHNDARQALKNLPRENRFKVIIGDAFHDIAVPQHLITREFFREIKARLEDNGIYLMNVVDYVRNPRLLLSVQKTLKQVFPVVEIWIDHNQAREAGRATFVLLAGSRKTPVPQLNSTQFPERTWQRIPARLVTKMSAKLQPIILTDDFAPVDRLLRDDQ